MKQQKTIHTIFLSLFIIGFTVCEQTNKNKGFWVLFTDTVTSKRGYKNQNGDIVIPVGKYAHCFTDTFNTHG